MCVFFLLGVGCQRAKQDDFKVSVAKIHVNEEVITNVKNSIDNLDRVLERTSNDAFEFETKYALAVDAVVDYENAVNTLYKEMQDNDLSALSAVTGELTHHHKHFINTLNGCIPGSVCTAFEFDTAFSKEIDETKITWEKLIQLVE